MLPLLVCSPGLFARLIKVAKNLTMAMLMLVMLKKTMQCVQEMTEITKTQNDRTLVTKFRTSAGRVVGRQILRSRRPPVIQAVGGGRRDGRRNEPAASVAPRRRAASVASRLTSFREHFLLMERVNKSHSSRALDAFPLQVYQLLNILQILFEKKFYKPSKTGK